MKEVERGKSKRGTQIRVGCDFQQKKEGRRDEEMAEDVAIFRVF